MRILVVDDHAENRMALKAILSSPEYEIVEAGSGREALRRLLESEFAVLLLDVVMPEMDGFALAAAIRERERTRGVPILFLSAEATDIDLVYAGYSAGAVDYLVKPLHPEMVRAKVRVFAELYRQRKRNEEQAKLLLEAERKEHELRVLELRLASERRHRALAEAVPHIVWTARPDGSIDYFNQRWFEYTGIPLEDATGSWEDAVHDQDLPSCRDAWRKAIISGQMFEAECRLRRASDGLFRWHLCRAVPERGNAGEVLGWLGTFTDIEDQKRSQAALAEFKGTLDAVLDAVLIFDQHDSCVLYANYGASALLGYESRELLRMRPSDIMAEPDDDSFRELLTSLRQGAESAVTTEAKFRRRDAPPVPVEVSLQLIQIDGGRIVSIARDISDRKRVQLERELLYRQAVDAVRARDDFLSVASHELRTPLSSLQLQIGMLLRPRRDRHPLSPEQVHSKLQMAAKQVERLARLIAELMDVSKIAAGRLRIEREELDLAAVVREVTARFGDEAAKAESPIKLSAPSAVFAKLDRLRVEQVVANLLTNAIKFGARKPIEITVDEHAGVPRLVVSDHGIGIAPEDKDRIFHRYEQAISSRVYGGLGLGLYIVRQIVEAHGGAIRVESSPGAGSTFTVEFPRETAVSTQDTEHQVQRDEAHPAS